MSDEEQTEQEEPLVDLEPVSDEIEGAPQASSTYKRAALSCLPTDTVVVTYKGAI